MSKHTQQFALQASPEQALVACREAVVALGWTLLGQEGWTVVAKEAKLGLATYRAKVTIEVNSPNGDAGSVVTLNGSNTPGVGPIQSKHLQRQMDELQAAITAATQAAAAPQQATGMPTVTSTPTAPAGWNPDPTGRHAQRYWDGAAWTEHVADPSGQSVDPLEQPAAQGSSAEPGPNAAAEGSATGEAPVSAGFRPAAECSHCGHALAQMPTGEFKGTREELREDLLYRQVGCGNCGTAVCFECSAEAAAQHGRPGESRCPGCGALLTDA